MALPPRLYLDHKELFLKTRYCPVSIARCDLLAAIFVMLKIVEAFVCGQNRTL